MKNKRILIILAMVFAFIGCGKKEENREIEVKPKYVVTEKVENRMMSQIYKSDAVLEPEFKVDHSTDKGGTIQKILKKNGDIVKKGEVIMVLSDSATENTYYTAKADLAAAKSSYEIAKNNYEKFKKLYNQELVSYLEYINYENNYIRAKGAYDASIAKYNTAKDAYDKLHRKADISGVVGNIFGKIGNKVNPNETLFTVVNDKNMESFIGFPAEFINKIKVGTEVTIEIPDINETVKGKITEINPIAQNDTKKFMIKISLNNENGTIKDGMYSYVVVPAGESQGLSVPDEAVVVRDLSDYVYKVENGVARRIEVKRGATNLPYTQISSPDIKEGDEIVVKGTFGLEDGDKVQKTEETK